ncbi:MAG TPA: PilW family protein [Burkholderiaceae bacterium]|jgi:type IV pilus assembly protein PilW|nr:PilW family protein [Burkholderiaceae bacterium]
MMGRRLIRHAGMGLIELLIAMALGLVIVAGMLSVLYSTRSTSLAQNGISQMQDDQRLALMMLTNTVQGAGYFPNPLTSTLTAELPANSTFVNAGQSVAGATGAGAPGDTLRVRYEAGVGDGTMDCNGRGNTTGANLMLVNTFSVDVNGNLICSVNGAAAVALAGSVQNFQVFYGVDTDGDSSADRYIAAGAMTTANWNSVVSVRITLTFNNPLAGQPGQPNTLAPITQVIALLSRV